MQTSVGSRLFSARIAGGVKFMGSRYPEVMGSGYASSRWSAARGNGARDATIVPSCIFKK